MENQPTCKVCNKPMNFIKAGVSRTSGRPYDAFWACPDKCKQLKASPQPQNGTKVNMSNTDPMVIIGDELGAINKRLDEMASFLKSKLG